jgi:hypothetical protein
LLDAAREEVFCKCLSHELNRIEIPLKTLHSSSYLLHVPTEIAQPRSVSPPAQPVVGPINPATLFGEAECPRNFDFYTLTQKELEKFEVEVEWDVSKVGLIHGVSLSRNPRMWYNDVVMAGQLILDRPSHLLRQIASWFDLSFLPPRGTEPLSSSPENDENSENELLRAAWAAVPTPAEMAQQAAVYSYYGTGGENVLDPPELPEAPEDGWEVELDTGPFGES